MNFFRHTLILGTAFLLLIVSGCRKENDDTQPQLTHSYAGVLTFEYTKGFPQFSVTIPMNATINKDRSVVFGNGGSQGFNQEDIHYEGITPLTKILMSGTVTFQSAKGEYHEINGTEYLWVWVNSSIVGQMTVWGWDDDQGWVMALDTPFSYADTYSDGQMEFHIDNAVFGGSSIKKTLPDLEGTFTYGYTLLLVVIP